MSAITDPEIEQIVQRVVSRLRTEEMAIQASTPVSGSRRTVAIGSDHGGFAMKSELKLFLHSDGYDVLDCGTDSPEAVDYPDFAEAVARKVVSGEAWRGIVIDGAGIGSCMAANKVAGVRAALCYDHTTAVNSREHNDANVLTLGAGLIGLALAKQIVSTWLLTEFGGGRHAKRVEKIMAIEKKSLALSPAPILGEGSR